MTGSGDEKITRSRGERGHSGAESVNPYDATRHKGEQVEEMFDSIAPAYDFMNTAMSFGLHRRWRDRALDMATRDYSRDSTEGHTSPGAILDVATGTGDLVFELHRRFPEASVTGIDLSSGMLDVARRKLSQAAGDAREKIRFEQADCLALPFADNSFDLVTVAYGVRNFERLSLGLAEMRRVLRPGGIICIVELARPVNRVMRLGYDLYSHTLIPAVGRLVSGDSRAYSYLPESIAAAPQRDAMTRLMEEAGFDDCRWKTLTGGVVAIYLGKAGRN